MESPKLVPIRAVPGLFISDRFGAYSAHNLKGHNIARVLSVLQPHKTWRPRNRLDAGAPVEADEGPDVAVASPEVKTVDIDDDPFVDILQYLEEACDWIEAGLNQGQDQEGHVAGNSLQPGVLVHCKQGISRSGAFVVAFLMRKFKLSYSAALTLARESRPEICPNSGFEKQLRVWEFCQYNVYLVDDDDDEEQEVTQRPRRREKPSYKAWIAERDNMLKRGEEDVNRARLSSLASMAARFGRRRQEDVADDQAKNPTEDDGERSAEQKKRQENWERVRKMEQDWNERLIRGHTYAGGGDAQDPKE
ncbi:uncharacterized protein Z520_04331 [Fonsecaea multimorphosa CBS 102226]|uniref:protein-tyrosine-phosphatase n=1 Tax=Fonsecaea multimorphosa CBS 102226 TaxID=1442371 RepID=A0A0D2IRR8_9EURO|nr:uncharacterized protein Z520_04331 [Fonsecaea multimorphosa CBS 102226]KIX99696.1 hypothetical protein Z520_04331 [Fonsecaea multimorphosa CBS 102226]